LPLTIGGIGLLILGFAKFKDPMNVIMLGLPLSLIFVLTFLFKLNEWRYFIYVYPLMILYMTQLFLPPLKELKKIEKI
jgi:predicted Co/Zn/Cd cation transporter (cation efflux family)